MTREQYEQANNIICEIGLIEELSDDILSIGIKPFTIWLNRGSEYIVNLVGDGYILEMLKHKKLELEEKLEKI